MGSPRRPSERRISDRPSSDPRPRRLITLGGALFAAAGLVVAAPAPIAAAADTTTYLDGVTAVRDVVAGGGRVFVAALDRIVVADSQGAVTGDITGLSGAAGLAVTPDGSRLYAALSGSNEVIEIGTDTLDVSRRIDLSAYPCPSNLSLSGDRLWVGYGCGQFGGGVLGLDVSSAVAQPFGLAEMMYGAPLVAAAGATVVIAEADLSPGNLRVYDVAGTTPTLRGEISGWTYDLSSLVDLAITPDGSMAVSAFGFPYQYDGWDTTTLTRMRSYGTNLPGSPLALAVSADGARIAGARSSAPYVSVYDAATAAVTYTGDNMSGSLVSRSVDFLGNDLFGVLNDSWTGRFYLWRMQGAALLGSALSLSGPSFGTALEPLTLTGRLTLADGANPGAEPLMVTRRVSGGTSATLDGVTTAVDGTFAITDTPPASGFITYDVAWQGDLAHRGSAAWVTVDVVKRTSTLTLSGPVTGTAGKQLRFSGVLDLGGRAPSAGSAIEVHRTVTGRQGTTTTALATVATAGDGSFGFADTPTTGGQYTYTVDWHGDDASLPAQANHDVTVRGRPG
jgi:YVTN family beta-propeller protein